MIALLTIPYMIKEVSVVDRAGVNPTLNVGRSRLHLFFWSNPFFNRHIWRRKKSSLSIVTIVVRKRFLFV
jgi:hypothetical protein